MTIPSSIYYFWFGSKPKPPLIQKCIDSWHLYHPNQVVEINDDTIKQYQQHYLKHIDPQFVVDAYLQGKFAYVADYYRMYFMYHFGGITIDADVECLRPLDPSFYNNRFFSGQEINGKVLITAVMGSVPLNPMIRMFLDYYNLVSFSPIPNTKFLTAYLRPLIKTTLPDKTILLHNEGILYPQEYFCPYNHRIRRALPTPRTYTLHHFQGSWK